MQFVEGGVLADGGHQDQTGADVAVVVVGDLQQVGGHAAGRGALDPELGCVGAVQFGGPAGGLAALGVAHDADG